jgi:mercuric reductase
VTAGPETVVTVDVDGQVSELRAERLLIATGRRPNTDDLDIDRADVDLDDHGFVTVDEHLRTKVPHIAAAGDVIGGAHRSQMATPVGSHDGAIAAMNLLADAGRAVDHRVVPRVIFVDPPVATVGMTERDAIAAGHRCWCRANPLSLVPRAGATRQSEGFVKMVADADSHEVLGVTMVGVGAHEVIHEAAMAMRFRARLQDFIDLLHVYPTMSEGLKIAAISRFKDPAKLSCCAE